MKWFPVVLAVAAGAAAVAQETAPDRLPEGRVSVEVLPPVDLAADALLRLPEAAPPEEPARVPLLADIPVVGRLFQESSQSAPGESKVRVELSDRVVVQTVEGVVPGRIVQLQDDVLSAEARVIELVLQEGERVRVEASESGAPHVILRGTVVDPRGAPVHEAHVVLDGTNGRFVTTDESGRFVLEGLVPGRYSVETTLPGQVRPMRDARLLPPAPPTAPTPTAPEGRPRRSPASPAGPVSPSRPSLPHDRRVEFDVPPSPSVPQGAVQVLPRRIDEFGAADASLIETLDALRSEIRALRGEVKALRQTMGGSAPRGASLN